MSDAMQNLIVSILASGVMSSAVVRLAKELISNRLRAAIEHEYAAKLAILKAELSASQAIALEGVRADLAREQASAAVATGSLTRSHAAAQDRRLGAITELWAAVLRLRSRTPTVLSMADFLVPADYPSAVTQPNMKPYLDKLSHAELASFLSSVDNIEESRPFVGESLWSLFFAYRAFLGRLALLFLRGYEKGQMPYWHEDQGIKNLLSAVLSAEELKEYNGIHVGAVRWTKGVLEQKILVEASKVISGEASGVFTLEQARRILSIGGKLATEAGA